VVEVSQQDTSLADKIDSVSSEEAAISAECPAPGMYQSCSWQQIYMCSLSLGTDESAVDICYIQISRQHKLFFLGAWI